MNLKLLLAISLAFLLTVVALVMSGGSRWYPNSISHAQQQDPAQASFTCEGLAARATSMGGNQVSIDTQIESIDVASLDDAISKYSVLVVHPNYAQSFRVRECSLETWYKLQVTETISSRSYVSPCPTCAQPSSAPAGVPAPSSGEILSSEVGGRITLNGVSVIQATSIPLLSVSNTYVVFANVNPNNAVATIIGGGFLLSSDGNTLVPLDKTDSPSHIVTEVASRYGNSLNQLRAALN